MSTLLFRSLVIAALMVAAAAMAHVVRPTTKLIELTPRAKLEAVIPLQFGDWQGRPSADVVLADPEMRENLARIYREVLSRTYVDSKGRQIMLSVSYGDNQQDSMSLHYPEVCYPAQGFQSVSVRKGEVSTSFGSLQVKLLEMQMGVRYEPITYWAMIGDYPTLGGIDKKLKEMRYGLRGVIADGLLFRVSSLSRDSAASFRDQERFIGDLLASVPPQDRRRLAGL